MIKKDVFYVVNNNKNKLKFSKKKNVINMLIESVTFMLSYLYLKIKNVK